MPVTKFTLTVPSIGYEKTIALTINDCGEQPNAIPICETGNECNYYINRFNDFMQRHLDCLHEPPEYYFGKLRKLGELTSIQKVQIHLKTIPTRLAPIGETEIETEIKKKEKEQLKKDQTSPYKYKRRKTEKVPTPEESYGYKYCKAFTELLEDKGAWKLSNDGKKWLIKTRRRLQEYLEIGVVKKYYISKLNHDYNLRNGLVNTDKSPQKETIKKFYTDIELRNNKFNEFAFATHPDAYNPKDMSKLPINDLILIGFTPELKEFFKKETWEQVGIVWDNIDMKEISDATWEQIKENAQEIIQEMGQKVGETIEKTKENLRKLWNKLNK